jgi:hypothetical protein
MLWPDRGRERASSGRNQGNEAVFIYKGTPSADLPMRFGAGSETA